MRYEQMKTAFTSRFKTSDEVFSRAYRDAMQEMVSRLARPREEYRVESLTTYESIIRDPKTPSIVRVRAQQCIDNLLGLHEDRGAQDGRVMPIIEVIVQDNKQAREFNELREMMQKQARNTTLVLEHKPIDSINDQNEQASSIEWD